MASAEADQTRYFFQISWSFITVLEPRFHEEQFSTKSCKLYTVLSVFPRTSIIYQWNLLIPIVLDGSSMKRLDIKSSNQDFSLRSWWILILQVALHSPNKDLQEPSHDFSNGEDQFLTSIRVQFQIWWIQVANGQNSCCLMVWEMIGTCIIAQQHSKWKNSPTVMEVEVASTAASSCCHGHDCDETDARSILLIVIITKGSTKDQAIPRKVEKSVMNFWEDLRFFWRISGIGSEKVISGFVILLELRLYTNVLIQL